MMISPILWQFFQGQTHRTWAVAVETLAVGMVLGGAVEVTGFKAP